MAKSRAAVKSDYSSFFVYDTDTIPDESERLTPFSLPADGWYYVSLNSISLKFPDGYIPDVYSGFLRICSTQENQVGIVHVATKEDRRNGGVLFPLQNPESNHPKSKIYNRFYFRSRDQIRITYLEKDLKPVILDRIVVTIQIVNDKTNLLIE